MVARVSGSKLAFIDLFQNNRFVQVHRVQCVCNFDKLSGIDVSPRKFKDFLNSLHRGDILSKEESFVKGLLATNRSRCEGCSSQDSKK